VNAQITLVTDADQTPVAPGAMVSDTITGGRRTLVTRTGTDPALLLAAIGTLCVQVDESPRHSAERLPPAGP
jgi:hypothetical protein